MDLMISEFGCGRTMRQLWFMNGMQGRDGGYRELLKKKEMVEWRKGKRREYFMLFSKKGFTERAEG